MEIHNFERNLVEKRWNINITVFLDIRLLDALLVLGSFQCCAGEDSRYDGIYFQTAFKKLMSDLVTYFQTSVEADDIKIPEKLIWELCLYPMCSTLTP